MSDRSDGRGPGDRGRNGERAGRPRSSGNKGGSGRDKANGEGKRPFGPRRAATSEGERGNGPVQSRPARSEGGANGERSFDKSRKPFAGRDENKSGYREKPGGDRAPRKGPGGGRFDRKPPAAAPNEAEGGAMRIAKRLARAGIASRRDAEAMIADGRVRLNGHLVETPAITVKPTDRIEIDGEALPATERTRLWLYHKPVGLVTTNRDPEGRPTVFDRMPEDLPRVLTVGRLDINTEGLLLLTNDGGLARTLELPSTGWLRRYRVRAHGAITQKQLDELKHGIAVDGVFYGAIDAVLDSEKGANVWMTLGLREGKNREVKRILGHLGLDVNRLIRISFGPFQLGELPEGAVREIRGRTLRDQLGPTLIEESGADFDAPVVNAFSNEVVEAAPRRREEAAEPRREEPKPERSEWVTAKGDGKPAGKPNRREFGNAKRESALARLDTKPDRPPRRDRDGDAPRGFKREGGGGKRFSRDEAPSDGRAPARPKPGTRRSANVWIAPGGRALGEKQAAARREREERIAAGGDAKPFPSRGFRDKPDGARRETDGDKPRRSAGFRSQSAGSSFGNKSERKSSFSERGDRPDAGNRAPRPEGGGGKTGRPFAGGRKPPGGGGGGRRPPRGGI